MKNVVVVGSQWGDEGKGKIVDLLSKNVNVVARYQGGSNAGHTVYKDDKKIVLHQIPTGILRKNNVCILGKGMVVDPDGIVEEIECLNNNNIDILGMEDNFNAQNDVNHTTNRISISGHNFQIGDQVTYSSGGGTAIGGLTSGQNYNVSSVSGNLIQLNAVDIIARKTGQFNAENNVDLDNNTVDIMYDSPEPLGGAQFDVTGAELTDASGGEASSAGWTVSTSSTTWLGFSFSGAVLPSGVNTLTTISFAPTGEEMCLQGVVFSDDGGSTLDINIGDCISLNQTLDTYGCMDMDALNFNPEATQADDSCLYDPFNWIQSTSQSFYVFNGLEVNGTTVSNDDSLYVIGAYCGDEQVGSVQWTGTGTTIVVMGSDGVTEGTENYCFEGLPQFDIPADIPYFVVYDAVNDEILDAEFELCFDSGGAESDCSWSDFGYNNIDLLVAGQATDTYGCTDMNALNFNPEATQDDDSCLYNPFDK